MFYDNRWRYRKSLEKLLFLEQLSKVEKCFQFCMGTYSIATIQ